MIERLAEHQGIILKSFHDLSEGCKELRSSPSLDGLEMTLFHYQRLLLGNAYSVESRLLPVALAAHAVPWSA
jgi:hypothetical protein